MSLTALTCLAHTHIPTVWNAKGIALPAGEWSLREDGAWAAGRTLPNGIAFGVRAVPGTNGVAFRWWPRNGTSQPLRQIRAQVCVMLGRAAGFESQTSANRVLDGPFAAAGDGSGRRWVITAWQSLDRVWQNPPVSCIHSDPRMDDCPPGETREASGRLWFRTRPAVAWPMSRAGIIPC